VEVVRMPEDGIVAAAPVLDGPPAPVLDTPPASLAGQLPQYPLVLVLWHDAYFDFDQEAPEDSRPDYLVHTVGFLVSDGPRFVSIAQEVLPDDDGFRAVTHIPVSIVERITTLHTGPAQIASADAG
jgi:hypothetical protein